MLKWANKNPVILLFLLVAITFVVADGIHIINYPPRSIHQWRQSDCVSYAKTYYEKGSGLFSPSTYNLAGVDGKVASEFPIIYYIGGNLFHFFGVHYGILRGLNFLCYLLGIFYLYQCIGLWMKRSLLQIFPIILLATSPFYYYYALNFLPNVPAISFSFAGLYYWLMYERTSSNKHLIIGTLFFSLATLLKPTDGGLIWVAYLAVFSIKFLKHQFTKKQLLQLLICSVMISGVIYGWYTYVKWYNDQNNNHQNLLSIYPIWMMIQHDIEYVFNERIFGFWSVVYHQKIILYFLGLCLLLYAIRWKALNPFLRLYTLFLILGALAYDVLWFTAFSDHDYYQLLNVMPAVFIIITVVEWYSSKVLPKIPAKMSLGLGVVLIGLAAIAIRQNRNIQHDRYTQDMYTYVNPDIYEVEPVLRKLGIKQTDIIVSAPDPSPNITLAAYNNPGYTESFNDNNYNVSLFAKKGAKYLIINDTAYLHKPLYVPYTKKLIGKYKDNIFIFDLR